MGFQSRGLDFSPGNIGVVALMMLLLLLLLLLVMMMMMMSLKIELYLSSSHLLVIITLLTCLSPRLNG